MSAILDMPPEKFQRLFIDSVPQYRALKLRLAARGAGFLAYDMPYDESLSGNPETGEIHEFAITTLIDAVCATAIQTKLDRSLRTATLDLRVDFMRKSRAGQDVRCTAHVLRIDGDTAVVRSTAYEGDKEGDEADPLVIATASFAIIPVRKPAPAAS